MTPVSEIIFSGFVSKAVNNCVDVSWIKIKEALKNEKTKHQTLESQVYNITVDVLNKITNNQYANNQDRIYDAAEYLLKSFKKNERDELGNIKSCLQVFQVKVNENECIKFRESFCEELSKNEYIELYHAILLLMSEQKNRYDYDVYKQLNKKLDEVILALNQNKGDDIKNNVKKIIKSRTQEYADKWNQNMFLNDFDKRDENAGVNVKLSEVYLDEHLPHYIWRNNLNERLDLKDFLSEYVYEKNENKMLLILGQPGIGKSTLITWIVMKYKNIIDDILVYSFVSDLKNVDWDNLGNDNSSIKRQFVVNSILNELNLKDSNFRKKTIILDGFDELSISIDRVQILNNLHYEIMEEKRYNNIVLIITCRENYINRLYKIKCDYITLQPWNEKQINSFCENYRTKTNIIISKNLVESLQKNKRILGIPLILYMILALNISVEKESSVSDVYDQIFSLEGGIYDRCIGNNSFASCHRINKIKSDIHQISKYIALWMFENSPDKASIPYNKYEKLCDDFMKETLCEYTDIKQDVLIGNYFRLVNYVEGVGTKELYFIHRSIYEYFVAETLYSAIKESLLELSESGINNISERLVIYLKKGWIKNDIGLFFKRKVVKLYYRLSYKKKKQFYEWLEGVFNELMKVGMFYNSKKMVDYYKDIISQEIKCFINFIEILRLLFFTSEEDYLLINSKRYLIKRYIKYASIEYELNKEKRFLDFEKMYLADLDLERINFKEANLNQTFLNNSNLKRANLNEADLVRAELENVDLRGADLEFANLSGANLSHANLTGAKLTFTNLNRAILKETIFDENQVKLLKDKYELNNIKIYIFEKNLSISFEEYFDI